MKHIITNRDGVQTRDALDFGTLGCIWALLNLAFFTLLDAIKAFPMWFTTYWQFVLYGFITVGLATYVLGFSESVSLLIGAVGVLLFAFIVGYVHKRQMPLPA